MSDEAVMVDRIGTLFLGGPPLVRAALGEVISEEELGERLKGNTVSEPQYCPWERKIPAHRDCPHALRTNAIAQSMLAQLPLESLLYYSPTVEHHPPSFCCFYGDRCLDSLPALISHLHWMMLRSPGHPTADARFSPPARPCVRARRRHAPLQRLRLLRHVCR